MAMLPARAGTTGLTSRTVRSTGSNRNPSIEANSESGELAAQAWGEQAAGYSVGPRPGRRRKPQ